MKPHRNVDIDCKASEQKSNSYMPTIYEWMGVMGKHAYMLNVIFLPESIWCEYSYKFWSIATIFKCIYQKIEVFSDRTTMN